MGNAAQDLYKLVCSQLWGVLERYRQQAASALDALEPEPGFENPPLAGRLLQTIDPDNIAAGDPVLTALAGALKSVLPSGDLPGAGVSLHGFAPGGTQPRGLAWVVSKPPLPAKPEVALVAALTADGPSSLAFEIIAVANGAFDTGDLPLQNGWSLRLAGNAHGSGRLLFPRGSPPQLVESTPLDATLTLTYAGPSLRIGPSAGPHLDVPAVTAGLGFALDGANLPQASYSLALPGAQLSLNPDVLALLLGDALQLPVDLALAADALQGLVFEGGGLEVTLPVNLSLPGVNLQTLALGLSASGQGLEFDARVGFSAGLAGLPLGFVADGLGGAFPVALGSGGLGLDPSAVRTLLPAGLGIDLRLPVLSGGGVLANTGPGAYAAMISLDLVVVAVQAAGLLQLPVAGQPFSFAALLSLPLPPPGIQLGFGFSLNGVGGIVAVNRRLDAGALFAAVADGSAQQLMFPAAPAQHGAAIVATLGHLFPPAEGHVVIGPMLQIGWGGRLLQLAAAVVVDLPDPVQLTLLARLTLALPDPDVPLVLLQATVQGSFEFSPVATAQVGGSLAGSSIAGLPLSGDLLFMLRGGDDGYFVISAGGFHPRYQPPAGVPAHLNRISLDLAPPGVPSLRSESYVAVTSNSVQLGCHIELNDEIAGCGVQGWFDVDTLFLWDPRFSFVARAAAGVAVQVFGETLMGISFELVIQGPAPTLLHGTGSVDLWLTSISLDFTARLSNAGDDPDPAPQPDLGAVLTQALGDPAAWIGVPPAEDGSRVILSRQAVDAAAAGQAVHPLGSVSVRQRAVPLELKIERYQNQKIAPQVWSIAAAALAPGQPAALGNPATDEFPPGEFLDLSEDQKLTLPAFERFVSGVAMTSDEVQPGAAEADAQLRELVSDYEAFMVPDIRFGLPAGMNQRFVGTLPESLLSTFEALTQSAPWTLGTAAPVTVLAQQPLALASTTSLQAEPGFDGSDNGYLMLQAAQAQFGSVGPQAAVQVVERWELAA